MAVQTSNIHLKWTTILLPPNMNLFKRKPLIPPVVEQPALNQPSTTIPRSSPISTYPYTSTASRDDAPNYTSDIQPYNRNKGAGDVYSRGTAELEKDRNELFSGYNPAKSGSGRFFDGPDVKDNEENEGDEVEGIKQQTRYVKQESVNSTRNALRLAREAEEIGQNTIGRLVEQSGKLYSTERYLDDADDHTDRAKDKTDELKRLNRSIFRPDFTIPKDRKPRKEHEIPDSDQAANYYKDPGDNLINRDSLVGGRRGTGQRLKEQRKRYQFESTASDDEIEDELEDNLDEISEATGRLKALGLAMGDTLDGQKNQIENIDKKTGGLDGKISWTTERLKKIK